MSVRMRTLFTKILLWFLLTIVVTFGVTFYVSSVLMGSRSPDFNRLRFELLEARQAWETEGAKGLATFLDRFEDATGGKGVLTDANGNDVLTGREVARPQLAMRGIAPFFPYVRLDNGQGFTMTARSRDDKYRFIVTFPDLSTARGGSSVEMPPQTWLMLGSVALLCYALARQLTSPLRKMQKTIERFGQGDFSARVNSRRADELGQLGRTVDRMAERIESLVHSQRRLLQDISHELRSPLARLGVAVELGRGGGNSKTAFDRIEREAVRLNTLVGELIQVTRAEGDPAGPVTEPMRLDELVRMISDDVRIEAERHQIGIDVLACEAEMEGNPELLRRAVENILRNAIRYSPDGGRIELRLASAGNQYRISVRDFGAGVPDEALQHIFDPFYRVETDRGRTSGGVGLGLAIARRAVELHHGVLKATNARPGLLVEIELPVPVPAAGANKTALVSSII